MSLKDNVTVVEDSIQELQKSLREYKMLVEVSRADIVSMENKISLSTDGTQKSISPQIEELMGDLQQEIRHQKDTNEHIQKQITGLKKDKSILQQHIIGSNTRCQILEENIGFS